MFRILGCCADGRREAGTLTTSLALPGQDTLLGSWQALARLSRGAWVVNAPTVAAAIFPAWAPLNNAILLDTAHGWGAGVSVATSLFADAGIDAWALWVPSRATDFATVDGLSDVPGFTRDVTTLVMQATLTPGLSPGQGVVRTSVAAVAGLTDDHPMRAVELPDPDALLGLDAWVMTYDEIAVAGAWSFLHGTDCGIYAVETLPGWRRRGLARALVEHVLADAYHRGARTATLQSTPMGQPLYEALGFRPVGRYDEWVPQKASSSRKQPRSRGA